ncbi:MAG: hypothetical protein C0625_14975 [Arcobacter sp.]|nr:MAG: hypothetical protein C0625_14975 [Arcobacter sp.]
MRNLLKMTIAVTTAFTLTTSLHAMDEKKDCDVKANGIVQVIATANVYNEKAKKQGVEFRRLNVNNSDLIKSVEEAIKTGAKEVNPVHFKSKKPSKTKLETNYAAQRACKFAISALTQAEEAKTTWRLAVPGDGYKY